jgi:hypothetical protein
MSAMARLKGKGMHRDSDSSKPFIPSPAKIRAIRRRDWASEATVSSFPRNVGGVGIVADLAGQRTVVLPRQLILFLKSLPASHLSRFSACSEYQACMVFSST